MGRPSYRPRFGGLSFNPALQRYHDHPFLAAVEVVSPDESETQSWLKDIQRKNFQEAVLAVLLPSLPRLEMLEAQVDCGKYLKLVLPNTENRLYPCQKTWTFQHLRFVALFNDSAHPADPEIFAAILALPSLEHFFSQAQESDSTCGEGDALATLRQMKSRSSKATRLELQNSPVCGKDIDHILRTPAALKTFIFVVDDGLRHGAEVDFGELRLSLDAQKASLETLWLGNTRTGLGDELHWEDKLPMNSLASFTQLKRLHIQLLYIAGRWDEYIDLPSDEEAEGGPDDLSTLDHDPVSGFLPPNLEVLSLTIGEWGRGDYFWRTMVNFLPKRPRSLRAIRIGGAFSHPNFNDEWSVFGIFRRSCLAEGVRLLVYCSGASGDARASRRLGNPTSEVDRRLWGMAGDGAREKLRVVSTEHRVEEEIEWSPPARELIGKTTWFPSKTSSEESCASSSDGDEDPSDSETPSSVESDDSTDDEG